MWTRINVKAQLAAGKDFLVTKSHKGASKYSSIGKYLAPGTVAAIEAFLELSGKDSDYILSYKVQDSLHLSKDVQADFM